MMTSATFLLEAATIRWRSPGLTHCSARTRHPPGLPTRRSGPAQKCWLMAASMAPTISTRPTPTFRPALPQTVTGCWSGVVSPCNGLSALVLALVVTTANGADDFSQLCADRTAVQPAYYDHRN